MREGSRRFVWLDVFTDRPLSGNGVAVVLDADGVDDRVMDAFAKETRLSETTFVQSPSVDGADYRNRIWTVVAELAFAGHPTLGTAVAVAHAAGVDEAAYVQQSVAGLHPVEVRFAGAGRATASMRQSPPEWGGAVPAGDALAAVGLDPEDGHPDLPPQVVSTGLPTLLVAVRPGALGRVAVDRQRFDAVAGAAGVTTVYAFTPGDAGRVHARCAFPGGEDPATGSAAGALGAFLRDRLGWRTLEISQGDEMGRPSRLRVDADGDGVSVAGDVVVVAEGDVWLE